jgi:hypothetical protein
MSPEQACRRISAALDLIDAAANPLRVNCSATYVSGYIRALEDEHTISSDGAQYYREDIGERRKKRLAELGDEMDAEE